MPPAAWRLVGKPLPVLALGALVLARAGDGYGRAIAAGLGLSAVGDVLLEWPERFVPGLVAFLLAHVAYTIAFVSDERRPRLARALPFVAWLLAAFLWLRPGLGAMTVPGVRFSSALEVEAGPLASTPTRLMRLETRLLGAPM